MGVLMAEVRAALQEALAAAGLAHDDRPLVVGVSGGPDSLALLDLLARLLPPERLIVAHLDHSLRPASAAEAKAVAREAAGRGLRYHGATADVAALARAAGHALEAAGRAARYDFLAGVARVEGAAAVVVGHNADDQAETILMHLLRGAGAAGLRGMVLAAPLPGHGDLWLLRPLLGSDRAAIEAYCRERGLAASDDASNRDTAFRRNRLRHELLPLLATYNRQIAQRLREGGAILAAEDDLLAALEVAAWRSLSRPAPADAVVLDRAAWQRQPLALRRRLLRRAVAACLAAPVEIGFHTIEAARRLAEGRTSGGRVDLPGGVVLSAGYETLDFRRDAAGAGGDWPQLTAAVPFALPVPGALALAGGWRLAAAPWPAPAYEVAAANRDPWTAYVAIDPTQPLVVRPRRPGERLRPLGLGGSTKIKEIMIDRHVPAAARALWPLVATDGHPLWLAGHVLDERGRVHAGSAYVVRLACRRDAAP